MKILFFARRFYPQIGGVEKHVMEIGKLFVKRGDEVVVVAEKVRFEDVEEEAINGIKVYRINTGGEDWFKKVRIWWGIWKLRRLIEGADVVHCQDVFFWYLPFRFLYPGKAVYTTFHGFEGYPVSKKAIWIRKLSEKLSWGNICVGNYLRKWYGTKPDYVIYGGINPHPPIKSKKDKKIRIGFVGRLDRDTGIPVYIEAMKWLQKQKIPYVFEVFGDGSLRKEVEKYANVHGFVAKPEKIMEKVDVIFSSSYLGTMEAFQNNKYVISVYDDNELKKHALTIAPYVKWITLTDDPKVVCDTIGDIYKNPQRYEQKIELANKWVNKQTWDEVVAVYLKLWKKNN